jgi:AP2-associated kinase
LFKLITNNEKYFSEKEILQIIFESAKGILAMHSQNPPIAHRDIKIENILKKGNIYKLCDFGSSTTKTIDPKKEDKNFLLEQFSSFDKFTTFMYRPPEMCDQYSKYLISEKVDVWMLGCVVYTLIFKKHPFQDAQKLAIINAHYYISEEEAERYSEKLLDLMRLMLTPNPTFRPSILDVLNILKNWNSLSVIQLNVFLFNFSG